MLNFLDLFPCALETVVKSLSESCTKFSSSHRPSGDNRGLQGLELTSACLMDWVKLRLKSSKPTLFFSSLDCSCFIFTHTRKTYATTLRHKHLNGLLVGKCSSFRLLKEIFQCRPRAKDVFVILLALASHSLFGFLFSFMTNIQTHSSLIVLLSC